MGQQKGKKKKKGRRQRSSSSGSISPQKADTRRQHSSSFGSISPQKADKIISPTNVVAAPANLAFEKRLRFGNVRILHFERCLGTQVVPRDGGWPLGLSHKASSSSSSSDNEECTIDAFEKQKQSKLRERWNDLDPKTKKELEGMPSLKADSPVGQVFETRQWDFKRIKNPLFGSLSEQNRMKLLLAASSNKNGEDFDNSISSLSLSSQNHSPDKRRSARLRSNSFAEHYNETYTQVDVHHVRNELEQLRNYRSMEGGAGCTCRKLHVYLLPPGGGGKKAHHRRMSVYKVKEELRKRHLLPSESRTREELEILLHDAVEEEPCCSGNDCPCVRNGIGCQADTCSCWLSSHQTNEGSKRNNSASSLMPSTSAQEINRRCGNRHGMYIVDFKRIDTYRRPFVCQEIRN